eukprot:CAMPEP_0113715054 /NCGR_PEP_ID=MMETSP0038_2-20120614/33025_1 /TAXON_ID=2898 /ORGANISM="Cryptomonas paramecium" /LENGTH=182 /DNA_ID=CAMNT_0000642231 /DNA_START=49 /DNA_END=594 /DNA_ORIENTATION=+ /assembly_acc=CAM_ASM_000170
MILRGGKKGTKKKHKKETADSHDHSMGGKRTSGKQDMMSSSSEANVDISRQVHIEKAPKRQNIDDPIEAYSIASEFSSGGRRFKDEFTKVENTADVLQDGSDTDDFEPKGKKHVLSRGPGRDIQTDQPISISEPRSPHHRAPPAPPPSGDDLLVRHARRPGGLQPPIFAPAARADALLRSPA